MLLPTSKSLSNVQLPELSLFKLWVEWDFFSSQKGIFEPRKGCKKESGTIKTAQRQPMCCCQALATACQGEEKPNCEETAKQMYWPAKSSEMIEKGPKA